MSNLSPRPISPLSSSSNSGNRQQAVKAATPDLIQVDNDLLPPEAMQFLAFDSLSAVELIEIARHDVVNGQLVDYGMLKEVAGLELQNSAKNILPLPQSSDNIFQSFPIKLSKYIPSQATPVVYLNELGDLVIEILNPESFIDIEVEVFSEGTVENDTIY